MMLLSIADALGTISLFLVVGIAFVQLRKVDRLHGQSLAQFIRLRDAVDAHASYLETIKNRADDLLNRVNNAHEWEQQDGIKRPEHVSVLVKDDLET